MQPLDENYIIREYKNNKSTYHLAQELNTYPKKIERIIKKHGLELRSRAEAQSIAIESGRATHPTMGKKRSDIEKIKISSGMEKRWKQVSKEDRENFSSEAKKRWEKISPIKKREMQEMAGRALRQASIEGSKAERSIQRNLQKDGYDVVIHKTDLIPGNFEIDLFLPAIKTIIEVDGPQHFLPIWGESKLQQTIKFDEIKNGLLINHGYCVIRIKYMCKRMTMAVGQKLYKMIKPILENISNNFPPKGKRFIELEINND